jgi:glycosyltransferase involved in cell wall biosynthesis
MYISVAMTTYNGARFLGAQLESLANQTRPPDELVIGDDGSTDMTLEIIEEFRKHSPFAVRVQRNETNLGYARNFLVTAQRCCGDWIAFCDQDDVWLPNKIAQTAFSIECTTDCCMILQNSWICDESLQVRNRKFPNFTKPGVYSRGKQFGFWVWPGFLKTIRADIMSLYSDEKLPRSWFQKDGELTHDKWTCIIANALGGIVVLDEPVALYRRHEAALTGRHDQKSLKERVAKSQSVPGDHYQFLSEVAGECADYLEDLATRSANLAWIEAFRENALLFRRLSEIQNLRWQLYSARSLGNRMEHLLKIAALSGYVGHPFLARGLRTALKDVSRVVAGARR